MLNSNGPLGPWQGLGRVVSDPQRARLPLPHLPRAVLAAYLAGKLPLRPNSLDEARLQALRNGTERWSAAEVALHLGSCKLCQVKLATISSPPVVYVRRWVEGARAWLTSPRHAWVGWSLAALQTAALVALLIWVTAPRAVAPTKPLHIPSEDSFNQHLSPNTTPSILRVRFVAEVSIGELSEVLTKLGVAVHGPDEEGYYRVYVPNAGVQNTLGSLPIIQELRVQP